MVAAMVLVWLVVVAPVGGVVVAGAGLQLGLGHLASRHGHLASSLATQHQHLVPCLASCI